MTLNGVMTADTRTISAAAELPVSVSSKTVATTLTAKSFYRRLAETLKARLPAVSDIIDSEMAE